MTKLLIPVQRPTKKCNQHNRDHRILQERERCERQASPESFGLRYAFSQGIHGESTGRYKDSLRWYEPVAIISYWGSFPDIESTLSDHNNISSFKIPFYEEDAMTNLFGAPLLTDLLNNMPDEYQGNA